MPAISVISTRLIWPTRTPVEFKSATPLFEFAAISAARTARRFHDQTFCVKDRSCLSKARRDQTSAQNGRVWPACGERQSNESGNIFLFIENFLSLVAYELRTDSGSDCRFRLAAAGCHTRLLAFPCAREPCTAYLRSLAVPSSDLLTVSRMCDDL